MGMHGAEVHRYTEAALPSLRSVLSSRYAMVDHLCCVSLPVRTVQRPRSVDICSLTGQREHFSRFRDRVRPGDGSLSERIVHQPSDFKRLLTSVCDMPLFQAITAGAQHVSVRK